MIHSRMNFACGRLHGKVYAVGGVNRVAPLFSVEMYDPTTGKWSESAKLGEPWDSGASVIRRLNRYSSLLAVGGQELRDGRLAFENKLKEMSEYFEVLIRK